MGSSSITLNNGSTLLFKQNTASGQGGAIYADTCALGQTRLEDCIVKHSNPALHPDDWGVNITFIDNRLASGQANAIYLDSVQSGNMCLNSTFCWKGWFYTNTSGFQEDCNSQLSSNPTYVNYTGPFNYTISADDDSLDSVIQLTVHDIWGNEIIDPDKILVEFINGPAYTFDQPSTLSSTLQIDCSSEYTNQSSLLYIHPLISLDLLLQYTSNNVVISTVDAMDHVIVYRFAGQVISVSHLASMELVLSRTTFAILLINLVLKAEKEYCVVAAVKDML